MVDVEISKDHRGLYEHLTAFDRELFCRSIKHLFLPAFHHLSIPPKPNEQPLLSPSPSSSELIREDGPSSGPHSVPTSNPTFSHSAPIAVRPITASRLPPRPPLPSRIQQPTVHSSQWSRSSAVPGNFSQRWLSDAYQRQRGRADW